MLKRRAFDGKLGAKDSGTRPTREAMDAAMSACGVEKPKGQPPGEQAPQQDSQESSQQ